MKLNTSERDWGEVALEYQKADPVVGSMIIGLAETWMEDLDDALEAGQEMADAKESVGESLRARYADLTVYEFTEALLLVTLYWERGEELLDALTVLERFLYVSALAPKLVANAEAAQETGEEQA